MTDFPRPQYKAQYFWPRWVDTGHPAGWYDEGSGPCPGKRCDPGRRSDGWRFVLTALTLVSPHLATGDGPLPCPFCGWRDVETPSGLDHDGTLGGFICGCPAEPAVFFTAGDPEDRARALAAWNHRGPAVPDPEDEDEDFTTTREKNHD